MWDVIIPSKYESSTNIRTTNDDKSITTEGTEKSQNYFEKKFVEAIIPSNYEFITNVRTTNGDKSLTSKDTKGFHEGHEGKTNLI
jgi:hypothetical protein